MRFSLKQGEMKELSTAIYLGKGKFSAMHLSAFCCHLSQMGESLDEFVSSL